jgi:hypothetical protein
VKNVKRFSFSLLTIFLLTAIAALSVSHFVMLREVRKTRAQMEAVREEARAELELVRKEFGHIQVDDPNRIQISRIEGREAKGGVHYRMRIPPGHRYFLHLADVSGDAYSDLGQPKNLKPIRSRYSATALRIGRRLRSQIPDTT